MVSGRGRCARRSLQVMFVKKTAGLACDAHALVAAPAPCLDSLLIIFFSTLPGCPTGSTCGLHDVRIIMFCFQTRQISWCPSCRRNFAQALQTMFLRSRTLQRLTRRAGVQVVDVQRLKLLRFLSFAGCHRRSYRHVGGRRPISDGRRPPRGDRACE